MNYKHMYVALLIYILSHAYLIYIQIKDCMYIHTYLKLLYAYTYYKHGFLKQYVVTCI